VNKEFESKEIKRVTFDQMAEKKDSLGSVM
jgi:hypothetical protein